MFFNTVSLAGEIDLEGVLVAVLAGVIGLIYGCGMLYLIYIGLFGFIVDPIKRYFRLRNETIRNKKLKTERLEKEKILKLKIEKYQKEKLEIQNLKSFRSDISLQELLIEISNYIEPCSKCSNNEFSLKKINETVLILECVNCNKMKDHNYYSIPNKKINQLYSRYKLYKDYYKYKDYDFLKDDFIDLNKIDLNKINGKRYYYSYQRLQVIGNKTPKPKVINDHPRYFSKEVQREVFERDKEQCVRCGCKDNIQFDHIIPFSKGGASSSNNCQILCQSCNLRKSNKIGY